MLPPKATNLVGSKNNESTLAKIELSLIILLLFIFSAGLGKKTWLSVLSFKEIGYCLGRRAV